MLERILVTIGTKMNFITKQGKVKQYSSGMKRDTDENKPRYDLIPPELLKRLAELYARGAVKYNIDDIPICCKNWNNVLSLCSCKEITTEHQIVTQTESTQEEECALNVILNNIQKLEKQLVAKIGLKNVKVCAECVMIDSLKKLILNTHKNKLKIIEIGFKKTLIGLRNKEKTGENKILVRLENILTQGLTNLHLLDYQLKMNKELLNNKEVGVRFVEDNQTEHFLTLTMNTQQEKLEGYCVEDVIKDLDFLVIMSKELQKHSNTCKIHHSIKLDSNQLKIDKSSINNWQLANTQEEYDRMKASAWRHFVQWSSGWDTEEDHFAGAVWNLMAYEWHTKHKNRS